MTTGDRRAGEALAALPDGSVDLACRYVARGHEVLTEQLGWSFPASASEPGVVAAHLVRPILLEPDWPGPSDPLPIGGGAVHADLTDDDHELLAGLRAVVGPVDPETLAARAQEWRLPVTPYRDRPPDGGRYRRTVRRPDLPSPAVGAPVTEPARPEQYLVIDLTSLWAGPLATGLLARLGVQVVKIDPSARPDALADHPSFHRHLNNGKTVVDLDLRSDEHRREFEDLVARADLVIDSFSRRVMPNFGYGPARLAALATERGNPHLATMSIVAFPSSCPERDWISYGPGVHAAVGLGHRSGDGDHTVDEHARHRPAPVAYPDALAGLAAFATAAAVLSDPARGQGSRPGGHHEVSLAGAIAPLLDTGPVHS